MSLMKMLYIGVALAVALTACGGGKSQSTNANTYGRTTTNNSANGGSTAGTSTAAVPSSLHCGAVSPVWANERTHVYHVASDPYYGRTKHGAYMCPQQAAREGYHAAGASGSGSMHGGHHRKRNSMQAQPSPSPASP